MDGRSNGAVAVGIAREAIALGLARRGVRFDPAEPFEHRPLAPWFEERRGLFVTLTQGPSDRLRGCIGFPFPIYPLRAAIPRAAWAAATEDPRFPPLAHDELAVSRIELSVLTEPRPLPGPEARAKAVRVGLDGLIVEQGPAVGLLLPQVAAEAGWDAERFLAETCRKAGLPASAWRRPETRVLAFGAELVREVRPGGPVEARALPPGTA